MHSDEYKCPQGPYRNGDASLPTAKSMIKRLKNWLKNRFSSAEPATSEALRRSGYYQGHQQAAANDPDKELTPDFVELDPQLHAEVESLGPGKNVLVRNRFVREDTGTHETLKILDDSAVDSGEAAGLDPYNTGSFDRSKNWDQRFRK